MWGLAACKWQPKPWAVPTFKSGKRRQNVARGKPGKYGVMKAKARLF